MTDQEQADDTFRVIHSYLQHQPIDCSKCKGPMVVMAKFTETPAKVPEPDPVAFIHCFTCGISIEPGTALMNQLRSYLRKLGYTI